MSKYLAIYGKPRYLGILEYSAEEPIVNGVTVVVESHRGEELAVIAGTITPEQEHEYRLLRNASEHGDSTSKTAEPLVTDLSLISFATDEDIETSDLYRQEENEILKSAISEVYKDVYEGGLRKEEIDKMIEDTEKIRTVEFGPSKRTI